VSAARNIQIDAKNIYHTASIKNTTKQDSGVYKLTAENEAGKTSAEFELYVIGKLSSL
jgi:hypothetical protein